MDSVEGLSLSMEKLSILFDCLSEEFLFKEILPKLPMKSLMRFKCVSKGWLARISSESFMVDHVLKYRFDSVTPNYLSTGFYETNDYHRATRMFVINHGESNPFEIDMSYITEAQTMLQGIRTCSLYATCNGLVWIKLSDMERHTLEVLCNPTTRELRILPEPIVPASMLGTRSDLGFYFHGLGFGKDVNDYKLVRIEEFTNDDDTVDGSMLHIQMYNKRSGCWRQIGVLFGSRIDRIADVGVVIDGAIHWPLLRSEPTAKGILYKILTFDLNSEELKEIDGPVPSQSDNDYFDFNLVKWKGCLGAGMGKGEFELHFWIKSSCLGWTKMFATEPQLLLTRVLGDELILFENRSASVILFDPITKRRRNFNDVYGSNIYFYKIMQYEQSSISPN